MGTTLYFLRQQPNRIAPSLFRASDEDIDIVFIEEAVLKSPIFTGGAMVSDERIAVDSSNRTLTYDDLIEKVFVSKHVIVL